jgi:Fe-S cluster assembly scaffold protein SufB
VTAASPATEGGPAHRPRPVRRAPADLPFRFPTPELAAALAEERGEPDWLRADRLAAAAEYDRLPAESNVLYTPYIDLRAANLEAVEPYRRTAAVPATAGDIPDQTAGLIELREDGVASLVLEPALAKAGVILETFATALERGDDAFRALLEGGTTLQRDDKLAHLARGFWTQGVHLVVPPGVQVERPILVRWAVGEPGRALIGRMLFRLGEGASASIVEELVPSTPTTTRGQSGGQAFFAGTTEVILASRAKLRFASIQDLAPTQIVFQHRQALIGEAATLHWALAQMGGRLVRSRVDNRLEGDRSVVEQNEIMFGSEEQLFDLTSYTRHVGRDTTGNLLSKGALLDAARSYLKGMIVIEKTAVGTDSFLGEYGMNLSKKARAVAIPSLEIDQPDCRRAMHSSSVGPIDETQIFYLESRGIPPDEARKFIVLGYLEPVVARVPLPEAQERLRQLLEEKWDAGWAAPSTAA